MIFPSIPQKDLYDKSWVGGSLCEVCTISQGSDERTRNYWGFTKKIPPSFYDGTTGIDPIDHTIKKVLKTGYCHHIERLMVLGNFMMLCEFDPDEVYQWFMEFLLMPMIG